MIEEISLENFLKNATSTKTPSWPKKLIFEYSEEENSFFLEQLKTFYETSQNAKLKTKLDSNLVLFSITNQNNYWIKATESTSSTEFTEKFQWQNLINLATLENTIFLMVEKLPTKQSLALQEKGFIKVCLNQKSFIFKEWFIYLSIILGEKNLISKLNFYLNHFNNLAFDSLDSISHFLRQLSFVSNANIESFKELYKDLASQPSIFQFSNYLFSKNKSSEKIFLLWSKIKKNYPIQFWTSFLMNKTWNILLSEKNSISEKNSAKTFFIRLHETDAISKEFSLEQQLETTILNFITNKR